MTVCEWSVEWVVEQQQYRIGSDDNYVPYVEWGARVANVYVLSSVFIMFIFRFSLAQLLCIRRM